MGAALLVADVALINVYYLLWFGIGAIAVGGGILLFPDMPLWTQITLFGCISLSFLIVWLLVLRPREDKKSLARAREELIGAKGVVVRFHDGQGLLRLQKPIGGKDTWQFTCSQSPGANDTVVINNVNDRGIAQADVAGDSASSSSSKSS